MKNTGSDRRIPKASQVWRELLPPCRGSWVQFEAQFQGVHRKMIGFIKAVEINDNGIPWYTIRVTSMHPMGDWVKPHNLGIKGNSRLKVIEEP